MLHSLHAIHIPVSLRSPPFSNPRAIPPFPFLMRVTSTGPYLPSSQAKLSQNGRLSGGGTRLQRAGGGSSRWETSGQRTLALKTVS